MIDGLCWRGHWKTPSVRWCDLGLTKMEASSSIEDYIKARCSQAFYNPNTDAILKVFKQSLGYLLKGFDIADFSLAGLFYKPQK